MNISTLKCSQRGVGVYSLECPVEKTIVGMVYFDIASITPIDKEILEDMYLFNLDGQEDSTAYMYVAEPKWVQSLQDKVSLAAQFIRTYKAPH